MKKSTIIRTILFALVLVNIVLDKMGLSPLNLDETQVGAIVQYTIELLILVIGFWKNNSFTKNAIKCDEILKDLKRLEEQDE